MRLVIHMVTLDCHSLCHMIVPITCGIIFLEEIWVHYLMHISSQLLQWGKHCMWVVYI